MDELGKLYEMSKLDAYKPPSLPEGYDWPSLLAREGVDLEQHYRATLERLGRQPGTMGVIFSKAQNRIQEPAMLTRLVRDLIDSENWLSLSADVKGDAYEGLLERNAQDVKTGAGQYFTPPAPDPGHRGGNAAPARCHRLRPGLRHRRVPAGRPRLYRPAESHHGPGTVGPSAKRCPGTAGRLWIARPRLGVMNLYLHSIGGDETRIKVDDSLRSHPGDYYDLVLTNPPFGRKSSLTISTGGADVEKEDLTVDRTDFWATTSNKQLNFLQHVRTLLKNNGRAAMVIPDNVLFEGGAGETVRRKLLMECDVHTLVRLPTGIFYAQGVKANVLFFDRKPASEIPWTKNLWIYDLRTNHHFTLKTSPLTRADLDDFVACYNPENRLQRQESERFRSFDYDELVKRDKANLDIFWLRDESMEDSASLPPPDVIAEEILEDLRAALEQLEEIAGDLGGEKA